MHLRSMLLAGAAAFAIAGYANAQAGGSPGAVMPQVPPNTAPTATQGVPAPSASLDTVQSPRTTLAGAKVRDAKGEAVGEVKTVTLDVNGKVSAVDVSVGGKMVVLKADTLTYVQADNTLISSQTRAEIGAP